MIENVGSRMHDEDMEGDIRRCWTSMRDVMLKLNSSKVPIAEVTSRLSEILLQEFGEIPQGYDVESKITSFVAGLFLTHRGYAWISQDNPSDPIMIEDRWPNANSFDEVTKLAAKLFEEDSSSLESEETESMRHAARLAERAKRAAEEEEIAKIKEASESENPDDWLVE